LRCSVGDGFGHGFACHGPEDRIASAKDPLAAQSIGQGKRGVVASDPLDLRREVVTASRTGRARRGRRRHWAGVGRRACGHDGPLVHGDDQSGRPSGVTHVTFPRFPGKIRSVAERRPVRRREAPRQRGPSDMSVRRAPLRRPLRREMEFPTDPSGITPDWLTGCLRDGGVLHRARVVSIDVRMWARGYGTDQPLNEPADLLATPSMAVLYVSERWRLRSDCHPPPVGTRQACCCDDLFGAQSIS
jgi:hypothetical protein